MSKKLIALLMAALMLLSIAAACGKDDTQAPADPGTTTPVDPGTTTPADPGTTTPADPGTTEPAKTEKVYGDYLSKDVALMNAHDEPDSTIQTCYNFIGATLYRDVPDEDGLGYHYVGDLAADMPVLVSTQEEAPYTKYTAEEQTDGTTKMVATEATGTLTTWQIKIRDDATWHNGEKLDAEDIMYSWKMLLDPVMLNQCANFMYEQSITVLNAEKYYRGECEWEDVGIKMLDGNMIEITCVGTPDVNTFCSHFLNRAIFVVYEPFYEAGMNADRTATTYGDTIDTFMSAGPYYLDTWEQGNRHIYKKNADHWLSDWFNYDTVDMYIIEEKQAQLQMFESGKIASVTPDADSIEDYIEDVRLVQYSSNLIYHLDVNDGSTPTKNENNPIADTLAWRKAMYHAIDRELIASRFFGYKEPAGWYVSGQAGLASESGITFRESEWGQKIEALVASWSAEGHTTGYNPELARQYLQEALAEKGLPADTKIECIFLLKETSKSAGSMAEWLDSQFDEIFQGQVDMIIKVFPGAMSTTDAKKDFAWDLNFQDWSRSLSRTYPNQAFYYLTSGYGSHPNVYTSARFDEQFDLTKTLQDGDYEELLKATYDLEMIYLEEMINIPIVQNVNYTLFQENIILPVKTYIPGFGWGSMYGDIAE